MGYLEYEIGHRIVLVTGHMTKFKIGHRVLVTGHRGRRPVSSLSALFVRRSGGGTPGRARERILAAAFSGSFETISYLGYQVLCRARGDR